MSSNTFGTLFRVTTFGESHGAALGCVVDGVPAGLPIDFELLESELARRRPGQSGMTTPRQEADEPEILSGVLDGIATGAPIAILFRNTNQHSADYDAIANLFRPGHADYAWEKKFGFRDARGGGRTSGRETVARVAAGAIAKQLLARHGVTVRACALEELPKVPIGLRKPITANTLLRLPSLTKVLAMTRLTLSKFANIQ